MSKLSQLQIKKLQELEYNQLLQAKLAEGKRNNKQKTSLVDSIGRFNVRYYDFAADSGGEQLCLMLQENILPSDKHKDALRKLTKTLLCKGWDSWLCDARIVNGLAAVGKYENAWTQALDNYRPVSHNPYREFAHLLRHLFAQYPIPAFLDTAFYYQNDTHIRWYLHLARGGSVRGLDNMPLHLTQKMRHYFLQAPAEATIPQALRYAQVLGLGGSRRLARYIMDTKLGENFENETFWETVVRFLIQNPMLDPRFVKPIIDFLQWVKYENREIVGENGRTQHIGALEPAFSMKGRSVPALLRLVEVWEKEQKEAQKPKAETPHWTGSLFRDFEWTEGEGHNTLTYRIKQIRTIYALREEGRAMSHCVATYYSSCVGGSSSIWSMTREDAYGNAKRLITIELNSRGKIQQARGYCNQTPNAEEYQLIKLWAEKERLHFSPDVENYVLRAR
ncbi:MAG: hypothetical protein EAZ95_07810 [Bacteroidetes bacterium]|nr:MAG: hypothetical protein EAZ95_07810 [Bacteroidota bacterium]